VHQVVSHLTSQNNYRILGSHTMNLHYETIYLLT